MKVLDEAKREDEEEDPPESMALAIATAARHRRTVPDDPFALYVVDSEGPPLVHVSRTRRCEVVIFGRQQKLMTPLVLGTGPISLNAADNDENIEISKIVPSRFNDADTKITTSLELADVSQDGQHGGRLPRRGRRAREGIARKTSRASWS